MRDLTTFIYQLDQDNTWNEDEVHAMISSAVSGLLSNDIQKLFQILYRIDVNEVQVQSIFQNADQTHSLSDQLSTLIIERLKKRAEIRLKYSSQ